MPNWTRNTLTIHGPDPESVRKLILNPETNEVDFEVLLPCPPILNRVITPIRKGEEGRTMLYTDPEDPFGKTVEATEEEQEQLDAQPFSSWYEWNNYHWGTKWNACHADPGELTFNTAWDRPRGWLEALGAALPEGHGVDCYSEYEGGEAPETIHLGVRL